MKKIFTLIATLAVAASVNAQQLYINGDAPVGNGWDISGLKPMTLAGDGYTNTIEVELTSGKYFAVCTKAEASSWD